MAKQKNPPPPHLNTSLEDMDGEVWDDVVGYDGSYHVSNMGRVKSVHRLVRNQYVKEKILKQNIRKDNNCAVKLSIGGVKKTKLVSSLVRDVFFKDIDRENQVLIHKNKVKFDNRVSNLIAGTESEKYLLDYQLGVRVDWGIFTIRKAQMLEYEKTHCVKDSSGNTVRKICIDCGFEKDISEFNRNLSRTNRRCKNCSLKREGVLDVGRNKYRKELSEAGLRICSKCKLTKRLDNDFGRSKNSYLGKSHRCKECVNDDNKRYRERKSKLTS